MNVQRIFDSLHSDQENSAVGIICAELEEQGYKVQIDGNFINSADVYDGRHKDLESKAGPLTVALYRHDDMEQEFSIEFIEDHEIAIERKIE